MPKDDWPPGSRRQDRCISVGTPLATEEGLKTAVIRFFKATPLEAAMFTMLMRRDEVTKVQLHSVIEACRDPNKETTEIKMVDVMICKLRKKLVEHQIKIETMWGTGYFISKADRTTVFTKLLGAAV
jgi:DNA-binding response OmpR family regulator